MTHAFVPSTPSPKWDRPPKPAGAQSLVCRHCGHTLARVMGHCGRGDCPNPEPNHFHCLWRNCHEDCKTTGSCDPIDRPDE